LSGNRPRISLRAYRPVQIDGLIRVGRDHDGGYVLPRAVIDESHSLLSLGVNDDWSFEEGMLARNPAMSLTCVDGTTGMARILRKTAQKSMDMLGHLLTFQIAKMLRNAEYLAKPFLFRRFFSRHELLPLMVAASDAPGAITLPMLIDRITGGRDDRWLIVKSDIEGAEFDVLPDSIGRMRRVSALLIEFHRLDLHWQRFEACMDALMRTFHIAHVHGNNFTAYIPGTEVPLTLEMTLINKALVPGTPPPTQNSYPLPNLDMSNTRKRPDLRISF
jgi:hypothetical protein